MRFAKNPFLLFIAFPVALQAQYADTTGAMRANSQVIKTENWNAVTKKKAAYKQFIVPAVLFVYGASSLEVGKLKGFNKQVREEMWMEHPHDRTTIDNYLRYAPAVTVFSLSALGIKGKNSLRDQGMIYLLSNVIMTSATFGIKKFSHELRPDGSDYYSFPSGHTAQAFASAEFLRQEYKDVSPWYGVAGYVAAGLTGGLRMYNNRHWMSDVLAGAGIGIASTKLAYMLYPAIRKKLFKEKPVNTMIMPFYQSGGGGLSMVYQFH